MTRFSKFTPYTVVIPVYNGRDFISRTLGSVKTQTVLPGEVILVDDCSTDGTAEFVESHFDWVTVVRQQSNQGVASARNRGIEKCSSPIVMLLDSDDQWLPSKAEMQLRLLESNPEIDGVFCDFRGVDVEGKPEGWQGGILPQLTGYGLNPTWVGEHSYSLNEDVLGALIKHTSFIHPSAICFRTEKVKAIGGFDASYRHIEDLEMWMRFASKYQMGYIDEILVVTESRPGSLGKTKIRANEGLVRLYGSLVSDYPQVAIRNKKEIRRLLRLRYAYLSELYLEQKDIEKAWGASLCSLKNGFTRRGLGNFLRLAKQKFFGD
jgi:glycosyltransferase involved in cell wall biosynthesis